jgi:hypothetical protein
MGMLDDLLKALDRVPLWKRLGSVPSELDDLKQRVGAIEEKLGNKWPADVCKSCGERALRMIKSTANGETWTCGACHNPEFRRPC